MLALALLVVLPQGLVIEGATVHRPGQPARAELVQIQDGRVAATSPHKTSTLVLENAHVYPGLHDAHGHLLGFGESLENVDLSGAASFDEVVARVAARARTVPKGEWIEGRGWDQNRWPGQAFPHHSALSKAVPDHPVWLVRVDGHAGLANAKALELSKIMKASVAPEGGEILRDENGEPTGVFVDNATALIAASVPDASEAQVERYLLAAQKACLEAGLTCVHDAGVSSHTLRVMKRLWREHRWKLRTYVMLAASETEAIKLGPWQTPDSVLIVRAVKGMADGALGSRGAVLLAGYADRPEYRGLWVTSKPLLQNLAKLCAESRMQLCVHAIGDHANRVVLDVFEGAFAPKWQLATERWRIEHAQVVAPEDFDRFRMLGVIPSMQPTHLTSDMPWATKRLGPERTKGAYAWRSFLERGVDLAFGSDFPVESHDPLKGIFAAVTTQAPGTDQELRPEQKLSRSEALIGFTQGAAKAAFLEQELGRIEPSFRADFTILDTDLETCAPGQILAAKVLATVIGGEVVYRAK